MADLNPTELFDEFFEIHTNPEFSVTEKYVALRKLLDKVCKDLTKKEPVQFANLFSRLSFLLEKHKVNKYLRFHIHSFRVTANRVLWERYLPTSDEYLLHLKVFADILSKFYSSPVPNEISTIFPAVVGPPPTQPPAEHGTFDRSRDIPKIRVEVVEVRDNTLICIPENLTTEESIKVNILVAGINDKFLSAENIWVGAQLNLLQVIPNADGSYTPRIIIVEPDYLLDISSVSECFKDYGVTPLHFFQNRLEEQDNAKHLLLGNMANLFQDELINEQSTDQVVFNPKHEDSVFVKGFRQQPFEFTTCTGIEQDGDFISFQDDAELQFSNIKRVVYNDFMSESVGVNRNNATLEPSFLSENFGIQGRLDLLDFNRDGVTKVIELKSGSIPWPLDDHSIDPRHIAQLYLYYLTLQSVYGLNFDRIKGYIFYSKPSKGNLRFKKPFFNHLQEILDLRNQIIVEENKVATNADWRNTEDFIQSITAENIVLKNVNAKFRAMLEAQIEAFRQPLNSMSDLERAYFYSFLGFVSRELFVAKTGDSVRESFGLASLWQVPFEEKKERFEILFDLEILENRIDREEPVIVFKRTNSENDFVNFREGDICILYPRNQDTDDARKSRVFKCSISKLRKDTVEVRFRFRQRSTEYFKNFKHWALEHDFMDNSYISMYRSLYSFIGAPKTKRDLILGLQPPSDSEVVTYSNSELSVEQNRVIRKALNTKDYFLLWGPPGTGKTSIIIKHMVRELYAQEKNILLIAYTNRAVDELCDAVNDAIINFNDVNDGTVNYGRSDRNFIRIGNQLSCAERHKHNLLDNICAQAKTRKEIREAVVRHRVFISTLASINSKQEIFKLVEFDIAIVDEASQILEPQIVGLLSRMNRFILVGDHKQLPAIVQQPVDKTVVEDEALKGIGLNYLKNSLFERLYETAQKKEWYWAFDKLTVQGRMHREIETYPNYTFYENILTTAQEWQKEKLNWKKYNANNALEKVIANCRMAFFPSHKDKKGKLEKANQLEAELAVKIVQQIMELCRKNGKPFIPEETIGIITPYRNQIALIKNKLEEAGVPDHERITVDTVERFQGSQRDFIILSFAVNSLFQLEALMNLDDEGVVDRKLNVAITRAKKQMFFIGNDNILSSKLIYFRLIEFIKSRGGYINDEIENVIANKFYFDDTDPADKPGCTVYNPDEQFQRVFHFTVMDQVRAHSSEQDPTSVFGYDSTFIRNNLIEYGRANFDQAAFGRSPADKVLLYCYYNMRKHYFSAFRIFDGFLDFFKVEVEQVGKRVCFFDFGCGPATAALAFNQSMNREVENFYFNYYGIDISKAMIEKAKEFINSELFNRNHKATFITAFNQTDEERLKDIFNLPNLVVFNFSYFFSNITVEQSAHLADQINDFTERFPLNRYLIVYQNPPSEKRNYNYLVFKKRFKGFKKTIASKTETVAYRNQIMSVYDKTETFFFEILNND